MKNEKVVLIIMIAGILFIVITPFLFTQFGFGIDFTSDQTNNIGGTIGGITSPFSGILGSVLVYYAFREQVKANKLIQKQLDEQKESDEESKVVSYLKQQLEIIYKDIENFQYIEKTNKKVGDEKRVVETIKKGSDAIYKYLAIFVLVNTHHKSSDISEDIYQLTQLKSLILFIDDFVKSILTEKISEKDRILLLSNLKYLYTSKIKIHFDYLEQHKSSNLEKCDVCDLYHKGIPDELFNITYSINQGLQLQ